MKNIRLPADTGFVRFDPDVGRLLATAEYPDESMLLERMRHDWRVGESLLNAVRQGRLRVRDYQTRFPLTSEAPSVEILTSLVSVNDLREFVTDLGYDVQVGGEPEDAAFDGASVNQTPETSQTTLAQLAAYPEAAMKKKALVEMFEHEWPSINADLNEMSRNGLRTAALTGRHGYFNPSMARAWAVSRGKIRQPTAASLWPAPSTKHHIAD